MSLITLSSPLLAIKPKVWFSEGVLHSHSNFRIRLLNLGSYFKTVTVDVNQRSITIQKRFFYFFTTRKEIAFDNVLRISYSYESITTSFSFIMREEQDVIDKFHVDLVLRSRDEVRLWGFYGEGAVYTGWGGVLIGGDDVVDLMGDQENAAHQYAEYLCGLMDKKLV